MLALDFFLRDAHYWRDNSGAEVEKKTHQFDADRNVRSNMITSMSASTRLSQRGLGYGKKQYKQHDLRTVPLDLLYIYVDLRSNVTGVIN